MILRLLSIALLAIVLQCTPTAAQSSNVTNGTCISYKQVPLLISYCGSQVLYDVFSGINFTRRDAAAQALYEADLASWKINRDVACLSQFPGQSMCSDCLAIRRRYRCAQMFPLCKSSGDSQRGICKGLCELKNSRCNEKEDCSYLPDDDCAAATPMASPPGIIITLLIAFVGIFLAR